ncbi:hypothetical protein [Microbacterium radiodurans]|uniref:Protein-L-isoaspartate carboxylmethyltransferase n=1 Tax=Microbacterium radiodurans TaxID=661398 RepID=A0A5J5ISB1_9MICO|nr:hypothetical protein [Microbacterium radiodurans]KAA9085244.1 hypothetical protein F6B42_12235 [Microbacterium radiodurans]
MPYRSRETLEGWLAGFISSRADGDLIRVALQDSSLGADGGLVIVPLRNASTTVYIHPPVEVDPRWRVVFEPQPEEIALSSEEVYALTAELNTAAQLCAYLAERSASHREEPPAA